MNNVFCINTSLPNVEKLVKDVKSDLKNLLNEKQIVLLWNKWVDLDNSNKDQLPTSKNILETYGKLANMEKEDFRNKETLSEKSDILDMIQHIYFNFLQKLSGKKTVGRSDIIQYQDKVFKNIPIFLEKKGFKFVSDDFERYRDYFKATRLNKLQQPDVDLDELEGKQKDTIGENSSVFTDNKNNCSDEVVYLIASLTSDEEVFGLPKPVNFDQTWNTIQNLLGNSTNLDEQIAKLIASNEPFVPQLLQKLDVIGEEILDDNADNNKVRKSFVEAFAKQQQDISITPINGKDSYSAIDGQEKGSFKNNAKSLFWASDIVHKINGKIVLDKEKYNKLEFNDSPESLKEFLALFGIDFQGEMTKEDITNASIIRSNVNRYLANNELEWLDFESEKFGISGRVMNLITAQLPYVKKNKNLSVKNANGKTQNSSSNHNYFSKIFSKLLNKIITPATEVISDTNEEGKITTKTIALNALEKMIADGDVELNLVSGAKSANKSESETFNKLAFPEIISTVFTNMFSATPIISLPRTSDKTQERSIKILAKDKNANMAYSNISDVVLKKLYYAFQTDLKQSYHPNWKYGESSPFKFWEELGLVPHADLSGKDYFPVFKETILKYIEGQRKETLQLLEDEGVVDIEKEKVSFTDRAFKGITGNFETKINTTVDNFNFNQLYFGVLITQMTQGSMSGTKVDNMFKRFSGAVAESRTIRADARAINYLNEDFKKLGLENFNAGFLKTLIHGETEEPSEDKDLIAEIYRKNNVDDAQGIMLLPMYKVVLDLTNQWTPKQEELYQKIMKGEKFDKKEFKSTFPPIKPVGYAVVEIDGAKVPIYIKTACYPISPFDTKGLENEDKWKHGLTNGIGLYIPKSGIKMAVPKTLLPVYDEAGNINAGNTTIDFPIEYFGVQLDINPKTSLMQLIGTQLRKLITTNLFQNGKAVDPKYQTWVDKNIKLYEGISEIETDRLYEKAGIQLIDGEPKITNYSKLKKMVEEELLSRDMPINIIDSLNYIISPEGELNGNTIDALPARQKIMNLLNAIVTNRLIKLNTNGTALVQISQQGWKMKKIADPTDVNILATKTAIDFVSDEAKLNYYKNGGLSFVTKGERTGEAEILIPAKYKHYVKADGTFDETLLVNIGYRIPTQGHNSMLHLKVVGYLPAHLDQVVVMPKEITSQGGSDFDVDKINLFIPNSIILDGKTRFISMDMNPEEIYQNKLDKLKNFLNVLDNKITKEYDKLFGSIGKDKAVDKLLGDIFGEQAFEGEFTEEEIKEILVENGFGENSYDETIKKIEKLNNLDNKEKWIQDFKLKQLQNEIITQTVEILEDPIVYAALTNPNNADNLKDAAARVDEKLGKDSKKIKLTWNNIFKGVTLLKTTYQMFAAKALVGVFASQATHHSLAQQVGLHFKTGRKFFFDHNKVNVNGEERVSLSNEYSVEYEDLIESEKQKKKIITKQIISDALGNNKLTAAVDAAKDDYLTSLGINLQTGDVFALGDRIGMNPFYMAAWINQPIIQEYLNITKRANSMVAKSLGNDLNKRQKIEAVLKKFKLDEQIFEDENGKKELTKIQPLQYLAEKYDKNEAIAAQLFNERSEAGNYSVEQLENNWFDGTTNDKMNAQLLDDFLYFEDASAVLRQSISTSKFDTAGPGKDVLESLLLSLKYHEFVATMNGKSGYTLATIAEATEKDLELLDQEKEKTFTFNGKTIDTEFILGNEQSNALQSLIHFAINGNSDSSFNNVYTLSGAAGTGKTSIIGYLEKFLKPQGFSFAYLAPTHAATAQLAFSTVKTGNKNLPSTIASSMTLSPKTGKWSFTVKVLKSLGFRPIIIVDEASMIGQEDVKKLIEATNGAGGKLIFLGDEKQIPEIANAQNNKKPVSSAFTQFNKSNLVKIFRQSNNALLNTLSKIREQTSFNLFKPKENSDAIKFLDTSEYNKELIETVKKDPENTTIISYTNSSVKTLNNKIRQILGRGENTEVGDIIVGYLGYASKQIEKQNLANSISYTITDISKEGSEVVITAKSSKLQKLIESGIKGITPYTSFTYYPLSSQDSLEIANINNEDYKNNNITLSNIFRQIYNLNNDYAAKRINYYSYQEGITAIAMSLASKSVGEDYIYNPATDQMEKFDVLKHKNIKQNGQGSLLFKKDVDYGHAITIHKSQGLTIDNVFFEPSALKSAPNTNIVDEKNDIITTENQSLAYVAMSRSSKKLVINDNGTIDFNEFDASNAINEEPVKEKEKSDFKPFSVEAPYANIIAKTLLNVFYDKSFNFVGSIYKDLVALYKNDYIKNAVTGLIYPIGVYNKVTGEQVTYVTKPADSTQASLIYGAVVNYLIQSKIPLNHSLVYGDNTIHHRVIEIQKDKSHPLHDNDIIQHFFSVELSGNDTIPSISVPKNKSITTAEAADFTKAFEEIQNIDVDLYNDFVTIAMYQTGVLQSPSSFYNYLPAQSVIPLVAKAIREALPENSNEIAREVLSNIGSQLSNIKKVYGKKGDKILNGKLTLKDDSKADGKHFILYTDFVSAMEQAAGHKSVTQIYEFNGINYTVLKSKNHKKLFYNFTTKADEVIPTGITESDMESDNEQLPVNNEEETPTQVVDKNQLKKQNIFTVKPIQAADKKAIIKASVANKYIGFGEGIEGSSTAEYAKQINEQNKKPDVILPIGTSGSGKSTFIKSLPQENLVVIEPDTMRVEFTGDMNDKSKDKELYIEAANRAIQAIKQGKQVVFDTTNLTKDKRLPFIEAIKKAIPTANIQYKLMELNPELAKQRIKEQIARGENRANVPDSTIDRHAESYKQMLEDIKSEPIANFDNSNTVNSGNYNSNDIIFVSIGGKRGNETIRKGQQDKTIREALKAIEAGATLITDNKSYVESSDYNEGEKRLAKNLETKGYNYSEQTVDGQVLGVWNKNTSPVVDKSQSQNEKLLTVEKNEIPKKEGESFEEMQRRVTQNINIRKRIEIAQKNNIEQGKSYSFSEIKKIFNNDKLFDNEIYTQLDNILQSSNLVFKFGSLNKGKKSINGYYDSINNSINIDTLILRSPNLETSDFKRILLHEIIHSVTFINLSKDAELTNTQKIALNNLNNLIEELNKDRDFFGQYGLTTANELLAELANEQFKDKLKNKKFNNNQNFFEKIISEIVKLLGLETTAYDIVKESFDNLTKNISPVVGSGINGSIENLEKEYGDLNFKNLSNESLIKLNEKLKNAKKDYTIIGEKVFNGTWLRSEIIDFEMYLNPFVTQDSETNQTIYTEYIPIIKFTYKQENKEYKSTYSLANQEYKFEKSFYEEYDKILKDFYVTVPKQELKPKVVDSRIDTSKKINIYAGTNENKELSNLADRPFEDKTEWKGLTFRTVEGAYQAAKLQLSDMYDKNDNLTKEADAILDKLQEADGFTAKALSRKITGLNTKEWDRLSSHIMKGLLLESFKQNPKALEQLLATRNAELTHTQDKGKWGKEFPKLLMEVRQELKPKVETMWNNLEDWQKEKLEGLGVTKEIFESQSEEENQNTINCIERL